MNILDLPCIVLLYIIHVFALSRFVNYDALLLFLFLSPLIVYTFCEYVSLWKPTFNVRTVRQKFATAPDCSEQEQ